MHLPLFLFLASASILFFVLAVLTKNFTLSLVSMVFSFASAYASMAIERVYVFADANATKIITHTEYVQSIPLAALFMLLGIASAVYAFFLTFESRREV